MADIILTCPKCQSKTTVSEYISEKVVTCFSCGQELAVPELKKSTSGLKLRQSPAPPIPPPEQPQEAEGKGRVVTATVKRKSALQDRERRRMKASAVMVAVSWVVFVLLAAVLGYIRFFSGIPGIAPEDLEKYGLIAVGVCYVLIIVLAVKDNMFDGLLCIVVPMYPFYYLFMVSNLVYVRAIVAAILVAFGYDFMLFLQASWEKIFQGINYWIQHA